MHGRLTMDLGPPWTVSHYVHLLEAETQQKASVELVANLVMQVRRSVLPLCEGWCLFRGKRLRSLDFGGVDLLGPSRVYETQYDPLLTCQFKFARAQKSF